MVQARKICVRCVLVLCVLWSRCSWGSLDPPPAGPRLRSTLPAAGPPKISLFFPSPATIFILSSLSWRSSRGIVAVQGRRGSHKMTPEKPKRAFCVEFGLEPRRPRERAKKERKLWRERRNFGPPPFGPPPFRPPPFWLPSFGPPPLGHSPPGLFSNLDRPHLFPDRPHPDRPTWTAHPDCPHLDHSNLDLGRTRSYDLA